MVIYMIKIKNIKKTILVICSFLLVLSNIYTIAKYLSVLLIGVVELYSIKIKGISRKRIRVIVTLMCCWIICFPFQDLPTRQYLNSILYYITLIMISMLGDYFIDSADDYLQIAKGFIAGMILVFFYSPQKLLYQMSGTFNSRGRVAGSFLHPNSLGGAAVTAIMLLLLYRNSKENISKKQNNLLYILVIVLLIFGIYLSNSRGAIVEGLILFCVYFCKYLYCCPPKARVLLGMCLLGITICTVYLFFITYALNDASYLSRINGMTNLSLDIRHSIFGYGMGDSSSIDYSVLSTGSMEIAWVKLLYKNGWVGVITFILIWGTNVMNAVLLLSGEKKIVCFAVFFAFLAQSFAESVMIAIFNEAPIIVWLCISSSPYVLKNVYTENEFIDRG